MFNRENLKLVLVAAVCLGVGLSAPAIGQTIVTYAQNADKVDGKHAVGAGATVTQRKGKLVATSGTTGRLPNNIIAKAPDSTELGGYPHASLRSINITPQGVYTTGNAAVVLDNISLGLTGSSTFTFSFTVPPDHPITSPFRVDLMLRNGFSSCQAYFQLNGSSGVAGGGYGPVPWTSPAGTNLHAWQLPGVNKYSSLKLTSTSQVPAGAIIYFELTRLADNAADNCNFIEVNGIQVRY